MKLTCVDLFLLGLLAALAACGQVSASETPEQEAPNAETSYGPESDVGLEGKKCNRYKQHDKKHTGAHQPPKYTEGEAPYYPPSGPANGYPAPGDSWKWWRKHDADREHEYKQGGDREPWGEYAPRGYGPKDNYGYDGMHDEGYYGASRGCYGLPPACDQFAAYATHDSGHGDYKLVAPGYGPSDKTRHTECASTGAAYVWPASCKGYNSIGSTCNGAALCQSADVPATATATCTAAGWSVSNTCGEPRLVLLRSGDANLQTNTAFLLYAIYTVGGLPQAGVQITGPNVTPAGAVTCTPLGSTTTSASGTVAWTCVTGSTPGNVNISVAAGATVSASLSFIIGTDCVGAFGEFGACSSVCADVTGERAKFFNVTTPAANGGRPCQFADGANITEPCTGELCCKGTPGLEGANVLYTQDFSTDAGGWFQSDPPDSGVMVQESGFTPPFGSELGVGQVDMPKVCPCPAGGCSQNDNCGGPFTRFGQTPSPTSSTKAPFWTNFTTGAPNGFVTQLAMYLDTSAGNQLLQDTRVDYSVALDDGVGNFVQDFVFNMGFFSDTTPLPNPGGNSRRFIVTGSNNSGRSNSFPQNPARSPIAITQSGWYIFQHLFYPQGNNLYANLTIYNSAACGGAAVGTWKLGPAGFPTALTLDQLGYVRYGWLVWNEYPQAVNLTVAGQVLATLGTG